MQKGSKLWWRLAQLLCLFGYSLYADAAIWFEKPGTEVSSQDAKNGFAVFQGDYPHGRMLTSIAQQDGNVSAFIVDPEGRVQSAEFRQGIVHYTAPLKGHHWLFFVWRRLEGDTLHVNMAKYRFYNAKGDISDSVMKEIRGKTNYAKYDRDPLDNVPFEIVMQEPKREHHISCCLFSGDIVRVKVYYEKNALAAAPLHIATHDGWQTKGQTAKNGVAEFELPLTVHVNSEREKFAKRYVLIESEHTEKQSGSFNNKPYNQVRYSMTQPLMYHPSALEWAAKAPAFATVMAVMLVLGFGIFFYRMKLRKRRYLGT